jgi:ribosome-associated translation inhibitor RaiA
MPGRLRPGLLKEDEVTSQNRRAALPSTQHSPRDTPSEQRASNTPPIEIRDLDGGVGGRLRRHVHERLARQLGKFAAQIERIDVRFENVHGAKGGRDRRCMVHVILSTLPPVIVEVNGDSDQAAFDLAAGKAEHATRRNLEKHGDKHRAEARDMRLV